MRPVVCIAAAGKGTRAGSKLHKALLPINGKAIITHIIDHFPQDAEIVVAVGHEKELIKNYCLAGHPSRTFHFVEVDNYDGKGSGPGYSMNCCREYLHRPFWFITCDCIPNGKISSLQGNWIGVKEMSNHNPELYSTVKYDSFYLMVTDFVNKSPWGYKHAYIGLCGIKDHERFWSAFDYYLATKKDTECEHVGAFYDNSIPDLRVIHFPKWLDTGTQEGYQLAKRRLRQEMDYTFEKTTDEVTYQLKENGVVLKLNTPEKIRNRIVRSEQLANLTPKCTAFGDRLLQYPWFDGRLLYNIDKAGVFWEFLKWCHENMWSKEVSVDMEHFKTRCNEFYKEKTYDRVNQYGSKSFNGALTNTWNITVDNKTTECKLALDKVNWEYLNTSAIPALIHGDLNFGNAIMNDAGQFCLIDWREDFSGSFVGDLYYDLGKLYAGVDVSWYSIHKGNYSCDINNNNVSLTYEITPDLRLFKSLLCKWIHECKLHIDKVKTIAALVYLNMSPLHNEKMGQFLYFLGLERLSHATVH